VISVLSGGFALGPWLFTAFEYVPFLTHQSPAQKRMLVAVFAGVMSLSLWGLAIYLGYMPTPADRASFAEAVWTNGILSGLSAFTSCTLLHTIKLTEAKVAVSLDATDADDRASGEPREGDPDVHDRP